MTLVLRYGGRVAALALALLVAGCGAGGGSSAAAPGAPTPTPTASPTPPPPTQTQTATVGTQAATVTVPPVTTTNGQVSANVQIPVALAGSGAATIVLQATNTSSIAPVNIRRRPSEIGATGGVNPVAFMSIVSPATITLAQWPTFGFGLPPAWLATNAAPNGFWLAYLDESAGSTAWTVVGKGTLSGGTVSFGPFPGPFTLTANGKFDIMVFAPGGTYPVAQASAIPSSAPLSGRYTTIQFGFDTSQQQPALPTFTANSCPTQGGVARPQTIGFGAQTGLASFGTTNSVSYSGTRNRDGTVTSDGGGSATYTLGTNGSLSVASPDNYVGGVSHDGTIALLASTSTKPSILVALKKDSAILSNASLSGTYGFAFYQHSNSGGGPTPSIPYMLTGNPQNCVTQNVLFPAPGGFDSTIGTAAVDGAGHVTYNGTDNQDGNVSTATGSVTYSLAADGTLSVNQLSGNVRSDGGAFSVFATSGSPQIGFFTKLGTGVTPATIAGSFWFASYYFDASQQQPNTPAAGQQIPLPVGFTVQQGSAVVDAAGNINFTATVNQDGKLSTQSGSTAYTLGTNGAISTGSLAGYVSADSNILIMTSVAGKSPQFFIGVRK